MCGALLYNPHSPSRHDIEVAVNFIFIRKLCRHM